MSNWCKQKENVKEEDVWHECIYIEKKCAGSRVEQFADIDVGSL